MVNKKIFLFGASFNPIHIGHIEIVNKVSQLFNSKVELLPNKNPDYKINTISSIHKLALINLVIKKFNNLSINYTEIEHSKYMSTYETLTLLNKTYLHKNIYFIIGLDSLISIDTWNNWIELFNLSNFIIFNRQGRSLSEIKNPLLLSIIKNKQRNLTAIHDHTQIMFIEYTPINISSTEIRLKIKNKEDISKFLDPDVVDYIFSHKLYM